MKVFDVYYNGSKVNDEPLIRIGEARQLLRKFNNKQRRYDRTLDYIATVDDTEIVYENKRRQKCRK